MAVEFQERREERMSKKKPMRREKRGAKRKPKRHVVALRPETVAKIEKLMYPRETYPSAFARAVSALSALEIKADMLKREAERQ